MPRPGELSPSGEEKGDVGLQAVEAAATAIKGLIAARSPGGPLTKHESESVDVWVEIAAAAGFHRGKQLSSMQNEMRRLDSIHLPDGYPT